MNYVIVFLCGFAGGMAALGLIVAVRILQMERRVAAVVSEATRVPPIPFKRS